MNFSMLTLEIAIAGLALLVLLLDLWTPPQFKRRLGWVAMAGVAVILAASFVVPSGGAAGRPKRTQR